MRFECNCSNEQEFEKMLEDIRAEDAGWNFEVGARLWYTPEGFEKSVMVEYQVTTQTCRDLTGEPDEPDWLTAYLVDDEMDDDCSEEIFTETIEEGIRLHALEGDMLDFAKKSFDIALDRKLVNQMIVGKNRFELVDELPLGYQFWNIGRNMPDGYLPLCRMAAVQPFEGARNIEVDTLKAVRLEGAQTVLRASIRGFGTVEEMKQFVADCQDAVERGKTLSAAKQEDFERVKAALEALKPLIEKPLAAKLAEAAHRSCASEVLGTKNSELRTRDGVIK